MLARTAEDAKSQRALLDAFFVHAPAGFGFLDHDLRHVRVNQALAEIMGHERDEIEGRTLRELAPMNGDVLEPLARSVLETGEAVRGIEIANLGGFLAPRQLLPRAGDDRPRRSRYDGDGRHSPEGRRTASRGDEQPPDRACDDRRADAASQPAAARRAARARARASASRRPGRRRPQRRPRSLQGRQRLARPRLRRPIARRGGRLSARPVPATRTSWRGSEATSS